MISRLAEHLSAGLDLVLPRACFRCQRRVPDDAALCDACLRALPEPEPLAVAGLERCASGAAYAGEVEAWVRAFKYAPPTALPEPGPEAMLGALLARAADGLAPLPDLVVPVPLHRRRLRQRGFNPAGLLARRLARSMGVPFDPVGMARLRDTPSQTGLDARERRANVSGAFGWVRRGPAPERLWLVDDVVTTGATLAAASRAARRAGVRWIVGVTAAATPGRRPRA